MSQTIAHSAAADDHPEDRIVDHDAEAHGGAPSPHAHVVIVGAGFSGLGLGIRLRQQGVTDFVILERAGEVGGTWRDNTYPGCACDVQSNLYSFSFAQNPNWTRVFPTQEEIWAYLRACAERYGVTPHIRWHAELQDARWDASARRWRITTTQGPLTANFLALGQGPLSDAKLPDIPGIETFAGTLFHSNQWRHDHDLTGERVAIIGTGASAIQFTPYVQQRAEQVYLFQRTPPWIVPRLDHEIPHWRRAMFRALPLTQRSIRLWLYLQREALGATGLVFRPGMLKSGEKMAREHLAAQVADPTLRARLTPNYRMGCKRILVSDDFYPALTQPNVEVVTDSIRELRPHSIVTVEGVEHAVDTLICATGFHVTDPPISHVVFGRAGQSLADAWRDTGMQAYKGVTVAGFPNLFLLIGPNTGLGHTSMIYMIESQINYIVDSLRSLRTRGVAAMETQDDAQARYNQRLQQRMRSTVWASGCMSWYQDKHGKITSLWPGYTFMYRRMTRRFDHAAYSLTPATPMQTVSATPTHTI